MILYHAGGWTVKDVSAFESSTTRPLAALIAYSERSSTAFKAWFGPERPKDCRLFMDSGAFPVFMKKATVSLDEYCEFLKKHKDQVTTYAALDVIGDPKATASNLHRMHHAGLDPLPTYHKGSPWDELIRLVEEQGTRQPSEIPYVALGGLAADVDNPGNRTTIQDQQENSREFLDEVFHRLQKLWPVRTHAFGATSQPILERYPLYSADSTAAIRGAGFGRVLAFEEGKQEMANWGDPWIVRTLHNDELMGTSGDARQARMRSNFTQGRRLERYITDLWAAKGVTWES